MKQSVYHFGKDFVHSPSTMLDVMLMVHPKENPLKPRLGMLCRMADVFELSNKFHFGYIDEDIFAGEMEKFFPHNEYITAYNDWKNEKITQEEYQTIISSGRKE